MFLIFIGEIPVPGLLAVKLFNVNFSPFLIWYFATIDFLTKKEFSNSTNYIKPKAQFKFSPTNTGDSSSSDVRLDYGNLFAINLKNYLILS